VAAFKKHVIAWRFHSQFVVGCIVRSANLDRWSTGTGVSVKRNCTQAHDTLTGSGTRWADTPYRFLMQGEMTASLQRLFYVVHQKYTFVVDFCVHSLIFRRFSS